MRAPHSLRCLFTALTGDVAQPDHGLDSACRANGDGELVSVDLGVAVPQWREGVLDPADRPAPAQQWPFGLGEITIGAALVALRLQ